MNKRKLKIALSGLNATDNPGPGVAVARALKESEKLDCELIGFVYENLEPGIYMENMFSKCYQLPYPSSGQEVIFERILYIHNKEKLDVIIPNFDSELNAFINLQNELEKVGIKTFLPTLEQFEARQKTNLIEFGKKYNLDVPKSDNIYSIAELHRILNNYSYPVVVKGKFYEAYIANGYEQVVMYFNKISEKWGLPVIIQEFIKGTEVNVIALGDGNGNTICYVPMRKLYITDKGKAWAGVTIDDDNLNELTYNFFKKTKWRSALELEIMKTSENKYYIMEINPRIPAWVYLSVGAGQNLPESLVMLALGENVKPYETYKKGIVFIRYSWDLITDLEKFKKLTLYGET
ncbi:MAG: ATP-grasp domain-containing protein [Bacteroidales bacterium]|nr:ATP-grasp domain-containing protein [Bacteroidales bacterium]